jgi:CRP-like cAMP-binding protein
MEDFYGELEAGDYFGQLGITSGTAKPMTGWCLRSTHFLYIKKGSIDLI